MKKPWFREWGWLYLPVSPGGVIVSLLLLAFLIHIFMFVDSRSHSVSDTLNRIFPYWVPAILLWLWIGSKTSSLGKE